MNHLQFLQTDLETRASVLLESGSFLALRKVRGTTCALYGLFGKYVEVTVKKKMVEDIDIVSDSDRLALYVKKQAVKLFFE
jgi:hypothetical protein